MKVWTDIFSGDEMVSDSYPHQIIYDGTILEVAAKFVTVKDEGIAIAPDEEVDTDDQGQTVVNVIHAQNLQETQFSKKDFSAVIKEFMKKMVGHLNENNPDRVPEFKKSATEVVKFILGRFDEFQFFTGPSIDMESGFAYQFMKNDSDTEPTIWFFTDCMKEEKF